MQAKLYTALSTCVLIVGCSQSAGPNPVASEAAAPSGESRPDQANLCEVREWALDAVATRCDAGQKVVFLPSRWGNEQLPIFFAAVNCDLRYSVAITNGAVTCIYGPITQLTDKPAEAPQPPGGEPPVAPSEQPGDR
jgi:hypothetical protein